MLVFEINELPNLAKGKGNEIMNIPKPKFLAGEEKMSHVCLIGERSSIHIHSGKIHMNLKLKESENEASENEETEKDTQKVIQSDNNKIESNKVELNQGEVPDLTLAKNFNDLDQAWIKARKELLLAFPKESSFSRKGKIAGPAAGIKYLGFKEFKALRTFANLLFTFSEEIFLFLFSEKLKFDGCQFAPEN